MLTAFIVIIIAVCVLYFLPKTLYEAYIILFTPMNDPRRLKLNGKRKKKPKYYGIGKRLK